MEILSIIPARGGSKGLPQKNIKDLNGKPLIYYTINASLNSEKISRTIVSTDCDKIANISKELGAEVPFLRPNSLANDTSTSIETVLHCLDYLKEAEDYVPDYVCMLQCTSPLRTETHINEAIKFMVDIRANSVVSVCVADKSPFWAKILQEDGRIASLIGQENIPQRRQDLPTVYNLNGAIYINKTQLLYEKNLLVSDDTYPYIMDKRSSIDIDDLLDFEFCSLILKT